jgi:hypothetical protein
MKILVVSDTHGNHLTPAKILEETGADMLIHLGDEIKDALIVESIAAIPVIKVAGNCDHRSTEPRELLQSISDKKFFITHGDHYKVKNGLNRLVEKSKELKASVVLFGHTHKPLIQNLDGILLINPGTLMNDSDSKSYAILTVTPFKVTAEIIHLI